MFRRFKDLVGATLRAPEETVLFARTNTDAWSSRLLTCRSSLQIHIERVRLIRRTS